MAASEGKATDFPASRCETSLGIEGTEDHMGSGKNNATCL